MIIDRINDGRLLARRSVVGACLAVSRGCMDAYRAIIERAIIEFVIIVMERDVDCDDVVSLVCACA